jgi:RNA polymerase sigma factor (sigma-70 family)
MSMPEHNRPGSFEEEVLPHLDAAYNLARWLIRNDQDAEDVVQEACLRAFRFFAGFRGGNGRSWLLRIVRNTCYTWLKANRPLEHPSEFDENVYLPGSRTSNTEEILLQNDSRNLLRKAIEKLPSNFREVLVLRELEGMSYKEISAVTGIPPGTVMSRLSRARGGLRHFLIDCTNAYAR